MRIYPTLGVLSAVIMLAACGGDGGDGDGGGVDPPPPVVAPPTSTPGGNAPQVGIYLNALTDAGVQIPRELGDERALILADASGQPVATFKGTKNEAGHLTELKRIESADANGQELSVDYLNASDRRITLADGTTVSLTSSDGGAWLVEFFDPDTGTSFRTDLPSASTAAPSGSPPERRARALMAMAKAQVQAAQSQVLLANAAQIPVTVTTSNCAQTADALVPVRLALNDGTGKFLGSFGTTKTGVGTYVGLIPDVSKKTQVSMDGVKGAIEAAAVTLSLACQADKASPLLATQACISVAAAIGSTVIGAPVAAKFLVACEAAAVAGKLACAAYDKISPPIPDYIDPAAADIIPTLEKILVEVLPDSILNSKVTPYMDALPSDITGNSVDVTTSAALSATIDQQSLVVGDIRLNSQNPSAGVTYGASAELRCIPFNSTASLKVSGTDGYFDETSRSWSQTTANDVIRLEVPGAEAGIRDTLTLNVDPRIGSPVTRQAYLVFQ